MPSFGASAKASKHAFQQKLETEPAMMDAFQSQHQRQSEPELVGESHLPDGDPGTAARTPKDERKKRTAKEQE